MATFNDDQTKRITQAAAKPATTPVKMAPQPDVPPSVMAERQARNRNTPNQGGRIVMGKVGEEGSKTATFAPSVSGSPQQAPKITEGSPTVAQWHTPTPVKQAPPAGPEQFPQAQSMIPSAMQTAIPLQQNAQQPTQSGGHTFNFSFGGTPSSLGDQSRPALPGLQGGMQNAQAFPTTPVKPAGPVAEPAAAPVAAAAPSAPKPKPGDFSPVDKKFGAQADDVNKTAQPADQSGYQSDASSAIGAIGGAAALASKAPTIKGGMLRMAAHALKAAPRIASKVAPYVGTAAQAGKRIPGYGMALAVADPVLKYGSSFVANRIGPKPEDFKRPQRSVPSNLGLNSSGGRVQPGQDRRKP